MANKRMNNDALITFRLPDPARERMLALIVRYGMTQSEAIREAVDLWCRLYEAREEGSER